MRRAADSSGLGPECHHRGRAGPRSRRHVRSIRPGRNRDIAAAVTVEVANRKRIRDAPNAIVRGRREAAVAAAGEHGHAVVVPDGKVGLPVAGQIANRNGPRPVARGIVDRRSERRRGERRPRFRDANRNQGRKDRQNRAAGERGNKRTPTTITRILPKPARFWARACR